MTLIDLTSVIRLLYGTVDLERKRIQVGLTYPHEKFFVADLKMEGATWQGRQRASES